MAVETNRTIFIVVDPAQDNPLALTRALHTAKQASDSHGGRVGKTKLHIFMAVDSENTDTSANNPAVYRSSEWFFEQIITPLTDSGVEFSVEMSWSSDWYTSILNAAKKVEADTIMLPLVSRPSDHARIFTESIWHLLRTSTCPVMVVQQDSPAQRKVILAAVNFQSHKPEYQRLNELILKRGHWLAEINGAELHIVNAYADSLHYPDRSKLVNETKVDSTNIHVVAGDPDQVIADVVKNIGAEMVLLGTRSRSSRWRGNTAEKIITKVGCDIFAIN